MDYLPKQAQSARPALQIDGGPLRFGLSDRVRVFDLDPIRSPIEVKRRIGYLQENMGFYPEMNVGAVPGTAPTGYDTVCPPTHSQKIYRRESPGTLTKIAQYRLPPPTLRRHAAASNCAGPAAVPAACRDEAPGKSVSHGCSPHAGRKSHKKTGGSEKSRRRGGGESIANIPADIAVIRVVVYRDKR